MAHGGLQLVEPLVVAPQLLGHEQAAPDGGQHDERHARRCEVGDLAVDRRLEAELQVADHADDGGGRNAEHAEDEAPAALWLGHGCTSGFDA